MELHDYSVYSMFTPAYEGPLFPHSSIFSPFEKAFFEYLIEDEKTFAARIESLGRNASIVSMPDFLNYSFAELMQIPVRVYTAEENKLAYDRLPDAVFFSDGIFAPFEKAFFEYIAQDQASFIEKMESLERNTDVDSFARFLDFSLEELMSIPVFLSAMNVADIDSSAQNSYVTSLNDVLTIKSPGNNAYVDSIANFLDITKVSYTIPVINIQNVVSDVNTESEVIVLNNAPVSIDHFDITDQNTLANQPSSQGLLFGATDADAGAVLSMGTVNGSTFAIGNSIVIGKGGALAVNSDGSYIFNPNSKYNYLGVGASTIETFAFQIQDEHGALSDPRITYIAINGLNDLPVLTNDTGVIDQNSILNKSSINGLLSNDSDPDLGDTLAVNSVNGLISNVGTSIAIGKGGSLTVNADGSYSFYTNGKYNDLGQGQNTVETFTYKVIDNYGALSNTATVSITITGVNDFPVAVSDTATTDQNTLLSIANTSGILTNDSDPDVGDAITVQVVNGTIAAVGTTIAIGKGGLLIVNADGSYNFDPNGQYAYLAQNQTTVETFNYQIADNHGALSNVETVSITITGVNDAPVAIADMAGTEQSTLLNVSAANGLLKNDDSVDVGDTITVGVVNGVAANIGTTIAIGKGGLLTVYADGSYTFDPNGQYSYLTLGQSTIETFTYQAKDNQNVLSNTAMVSITILDSVVANQSPIAVNDAGVTTQNTTLSVVAGSGLLSNDTDPNVNDTITVNEINGSAANVGTTISIGKGGLLTVNADGSYTFNPNNQYAYLSAGTNIVETFTYQAQDNYAAASNTATVSITINGLNDSPIAVNDAGVTNQNTTLSVAAGSGLLSNDNDPDTGDTITIGTINGGLFNTGATIKIGKGGLLTVNADGSYIFNTNGKYNYLAAGNSTIETFTYQAKDNLGALSNQATVSLTITGVNDPPTINNLNGDTFSYINGSGAQIIDQSTMVSVSDDSPDFNTGVLTAKITHNAIPTQDKLSIHDTVGAITHTATTVSYAGTVIGALSGDGTTGLSITLNANANTTNTAALIHAITYQNISTNPTELSRTVSFTLTDGDGGTSNTANVTIDVEHCDLPLSSNIIYVTTFNDVVNAGDGLISLREAVIQANSNNNPNQLDTIILQAGTYKLTIGGSESAAANAAVQDLDITQSVQIIGAGADSTFIQANRTVGRSFEVFDTPNNNNCGGLRLESLTVQGGDVGSGGSDENGGAIWVNGFLELQDVVLRQNQADDFGGAVYAQDGAIITVENSTIMGNWSDEDNNAGGAFYITGGTTLTLINSTVAYNAAPKNQGGAIYANASTIYVVDSTIAYNSAASAGGGIYLTNGATATLSGSIVAKNFLNAGITYGTANGIPAITALNFTGKTENDLSGAGTYTYNSTGYNLVGVSNTVTLTAHTGDLFGTSALPKNPLLVGTQPVYNGGSTPTLALQSSSPAINANDPNNTISDQRYADPVGVRDIGAYEYQGVVPPIILDLNGDGIKLLSLADSKVSMELFGAGILTKVGWVGAEDGILIYDVNHDRQVTNLNEIALSGYASGAKTDLEGLRMAFDSNHDNVFNLNDDAFSNFGVWQDKNGDGVSQEGEYHTLQEMNIQSISLISDNKISDNEGNIIFGNTTYTTIDGTQHAVADVGLQIGISTIMLPITKDDIGSVPTDSPLNVDITSDLLSNDFASMTSTNTDNSVVSTVVSTTTNTSLNLSEVVLDQSEINFSNLTNDTEKNVTVESSSSATNSNITSVATAENTTSSAVSVVVPVASSTPSASSANVESTSTVTSTSSEKILPEMMPTTEQHA